MDVQPYIKVDKISDDVYSIAPNVILKFNTSLSRTNDGNRYHFHREFEYKSKVDNPSTLVTIKRTFDYYLSIENNQKDPTTGNKLFIRIGAAEILLFKRGLETAISWFTDSKYESLFARKNGTIVMLPPIPNPFRVGKLPMDKYIEFSPTIIDKGIGNYDKEPGVKIELGSRNYVINISIERLMGLYYIISNFDMYQCALLQINYLGRPEFGTNRYVMETSHTMSEDDGTREGSTGVSGRFVTPRNAKNNIEILE